MLLWQFYLYDIMKITGNFNIHFSVFLAYKVDPLLFTGRGIHLRLVPSMLCFSDKWSVLGYLCLESKLAIKGPINCLDQIFWTYVVRLVTLWPLMYSQVVSMKISPEISILLFLTHFSVCELFASSFSVSNNKETSMTSSWCFYC